MHGFDSPQIFCGRVIAKQSTGLEPGCRTVSNNGSGSSLAPAQNILAVQVWFGFT